MIKLTLLFIFLSGAVQAQMLSNYQKALSILEKSIQATGRFSHSLQISAKGKRFNMGHYARPEVIKENLLEETYAYFPVEKDYYIYGQLSSGLNDYYRVGISNADSLYEKGYFSEKLAKKLSEDFILEIAKTMPSVILNLAHENRKSLRYAGLEKNEEVISFAYGHNQIITLHIDNQSNLPVRIAMLAYDPLIGDGTHETTFENFTDFSGVKIPLLRKDYEFGRLERELKYEKPLFKVRPDSTVAKYKLKKNFLDKITTPVKTKEDLEFSSLSPSLDLIKITSQNNKILVAKFSDYIGLFEVPQGINLNLQLQAELKKRYPGKPLKYLFLTHHHPDHAGGIRAYVNLPATLVTTQGNQAYFDKLMTTSHTLASVNLEKPEKKVKQEFVPLNSQKTFKDKANEVIAFEIGARTDHTAEHMVYYFPKSKILWTGDLLLFNKGDIVYPGGARGKAVYDVILKNNLKVEKIYTSWPLLGQKEYGTLEFVKKLVNAK